MSRKAKGDRAEERAVAFLIAQGLQVVERNFRVDGGEIDIIANDHQAYVFVEVKYRHDEGFAAALEQISFGQCRRIRLTAQRYLMQRGLDQHRLKLRFDVITITGPEASTHWLKDAF